MSGPHDTDNLLDRLGLKEYESRALEQLFSLSRSTAPNLAEATGIPNARIYSVLDSLADKGFVKIIPGRPKEYSVKPPEAVLERAIENERQAFEQSRHQLEATRESFLRTFQPLYERAGDEVGPAEELFYVTDVGEPSETETRRLYQNATCDLYIITKSFDYFESVEPAVIDAIDRNIDLSALFVDPTHLSERNQRIQRTRYEDLSTRYPELEIRFSNEPLPWRGTLVDPSMEYDSGTAIMLVEEKDVPLHLRQAAVTENASFVAGLKRYFDLIWEHDSVAAYPE